MLLHLRIVITGSALTLGGQALASYDEHEATIYANFARVAFCQKAAVETWKCGEMCDATLTVPSRVRFLGPGPRWEVQGYVAKVAKQSCVLSFRGSITAMNWMADMRFLKKWWPPEQRNWWCPGCKVHSGFAAAYEELRPEMLTALRELDCGRLAVTGHSLGAALANLAAAELKASGEAQVGPIFTFGEPRVGNTAFVTAIRGFANLLPQWRVVHYRDPVARLPPTGLDYQHAGEEVYYDTENSSGFKVCNSTPQGHENRECSAEVPFYKCINFDHLTYLNLSFVGHKMPPSCTGGFISETRRKPRPQFESLEVLV